MRQVTSSDRLKTYRVTCWKHIYGYYDVEAKNEDEAKEKADKHLWNGVIMDDVIDIDADVEGVEDILER